MTRDRTSAIAILSAIAVLGGVVGAINASGVDVFADGGPVVWRLYAMNTFGGLVTIAGGLVAAAAAVRRSKAIAAIAGLVFLGMAALTVIGNGQSYNLFGGRGSSASFWLMLGVGLTALAISPEAAGVRGPTSDRRA